MDLVLYTTDFDAVSTQGMLYQPAGFQCYTLELPYTDGSVGTAIPAGRFRVVLQPSPKFLRVTQDPNVEQSTRDFFSQYASKMPHIVDIPGRSLIMFHPGNDAHNTEGCVLVGQSKGHDLLSSSRPAFAALYKLIHDPAANGDCFLTVNRDRR